MLLSLQVITNKSKNHLIVKNSITYFSSRSFYMKAYHLNVLKKTIISYLYCSFNQYFIYLRVLGQTRLNRLTPSVSTIII